MESNGKLKDKPEVLVLTLTVSFLLLFASTVSIILLKVSHFY